MKNIRLISKKDLSPGPGQYNFFSIFEGYSKDKNLKENKIKKIKPKENQQLIFFSYIFLFILIDFFNNIFFIYIKFLLRFLYNI